MRQPDPERDQADGGALGQVLGDIFRTIAAGQTVPLSRDGQVVAVVVPPDVAEAGLRALGR
jgi:antitoxin (DNA-binding transcriptional repressor) of toxin-antitoxin stability system